MQDFFLLFEAERLKHSSAALSLVLVGAGGVMWVGHLDQLQFSCSDWLVGAV